MTLEHERKGAIFEVRSRYITVKSFWAEATVVTINPTALKIKCPAEHQAERQRSGSYCAHMWSKYDHGYDEMIHKNTNDMSIIVNHCVFRTPSLWTPGNGSPLGILTDILRHLGRSSPTPQLRHQQCRRKTCKLSWTHSFYKSWVWVYWTIFSEPPNKLVT